MPRVVILCTDPERKAFVESALKGLDAPVVSEYGMLEKEITRKNTHMAIVDAFGQSEVAPFIARTIRMSPHGKTLRILVLAEKAGEDYSSYTLAGVDEVIVPPLKKKAFQEAVLRHLKELSGRADASPPKAASEPKPPATPVSQKPVETPPPLPKTASVPPTTTETSAPAPNPPESPAKSDVHPQKASAGVEPPKSFVNDLAVHVRNILGKLNDSDRERIGDERLARLLYFWKHLDSIDYYQFLAVPRDEPVKTIRLAYFKMSKIYHTDRFALVHNKRFYEIANGIWKRMTEAYQVLTNPEKKAKYDKNLSSGRRPDTVRLIEKQKEEYTKAPGSTLKDPNARKFFKLGLSAFEEGKWSAALMNFQIAESSQKGNEELAEYIRKCKEQKG